MFHPKKLEVYLSSSLKSCHPIRFVGLFVLTIVSCILAARFIDYYLPYRPTVQEATNYVQTQEGRQHTEPVTGHTLSFTNIQILDLFSEVPATVVAVKTMQRTEQDGESIVETAHCLEAEYITRHWLSGVRAYSSTGPGCIVWDKLALYPPIRTQGKREKGTYLLTGLVTDESIKSVQVQWRDGVERIVPVVNQSFVDFRATGIEVTSVAGLDGQGKIITDTLTANRDVHFTPLDYTAYEQIMMGDGITVLGAYSLSGPEPQECLEVTYLTVENAEKFLRGEQYFRGQRACVIGTTSDVIAPVVSTLVAGDRVISGRVRHEDIYYVRVLWSDSMEQTVSVLDGGFFFARRPVSSGASLSSKAITGFDSSGNVVSP